MIHVLEIDTQVRKKLYEVLYGWKICSGREGEDEGSPLEMADAQPIGKSKWAAYKFGKNVYI